MGKLIGFALRFFQLLFAACVLALSILAVKWQYYYSAPAASKFACFVGGFGCLTALLGFAAVLIEPLAGIFMSIMDVLGSIFFLAGGVAFAVILRRTNCDNGNAERTWHNKLISGGCYYIEDEDVFSCGFFTASDVERRCHRVKADTAFMFLGFVASFGAVILSLLFIKSKRSTTQSSV